MPVPKIKKKSCISRSERDKCSWHHFKSDDEASIVKNKLLDWYTKNARTLPWRTIALSETDLNVRGYCVWVSEIMLQQTQVATVIDYYNRWIKRWPTVTDLSKATLDEVNQMWSGLGYYSRGRRLWEGAKKVVDELGGQIPRTSEVLLKEIPGVGRYTAAAIASIAFGEPAPLVDGNVVRVIARMRRIGADVSSNEVSEEIWTIARSLVDPDRPGDLNQSLMELGATVCTPKQPQCNNCPVSDKCLAFAEITRQKEENKYRVAKRKSEKLPDIEDCVQDCFLCLPSTETYKSDDGVLNYPRKAKKSSVREQRSVVVVLNDGDLFCLLQRPPTGLLANLLEFPSFEVEDDGSEITKSLVEKTMQERFSVSVSQVKNLGDLIHQFSHIRQTYSVWRAVCSTQNKIQYPQDQYQKCEWLKKEDLVSSAISTAMKKVFKLATVEKSKAKKRELDEKPEPSKQRKIKDFFSKQV